MEQIRSGATAAFQKRLQDRLSELLRGSNVEPQRLAQEAALLADRSDISEELIRLKTHAAESEELVRAGGEVGKKLDFLLQEMNRETNTILSKTGGLGDIGVDHHGAGARRKIRNRQNSRAIVKSGVAR